MIFTMGLFQRLTTSFSPPWLNEQNASFEANYFLSLKFHCVFISYILFICKCVMCNGLDIFRASTIGNFNLFFPISIKFNNKNMTRNSLHSLYWFTLNSRNVYVTFDKRNSIGIDSVWSMRSINDEETHSLVKLYQYASIHFAFNISVE